MNTQVLPRLRLPPVEFVHLAKPEPPKRRCQTQRAKDSWLMHGGEPLQRGDIEMVIVIVTNEKAVDLRKIFEANAWVPMALRTGKADRADAKRPDRIGEDVESFRLQQDSGMVNKGDAERSTLDLRGRPRSRSGGNPSSPRPDFAIGHPLERPGKAVLRNSRIEEAAVAEMFDGGRAFNRCGRPVRGIGHE